MSIDLARAKFNDIVKNSAGAVTQQGLLEAHLRFPNNFEYYLMGIEIVNSSNQIEDRFVFPVLPDRVSINNKKIKTITKTNAGITVFENNTFQPIPISMSGTFGRKFRLMANLKSSPGDGANNAFKQFQLNVRTGYGAMKELERLYKKSSETDDNNKPFRVHFYNLAFNQIFVVEWTDMTFSQDVNSNNMYWNYSMNMVAVAPADIQDFQTNQRRFGQIDVINKTINNLVQDALSI